MPRSSGDHLPDGNEKRGPYTLRLGRHRLTVAAVLAFVVLWNLYFLRATLVDVAYPNDSAMHSEMVRFATKLLRHGLWPATHWFNQLNAGSPHFLHYQELGALIVGALGILIGPNTAFHWSLYLLIACWPIVIYVSARIFKMPVLAALGSAALSSFLFSVRGVGYEQQAYIWVGFGMWAQLVASWFLPLAWACTWRSITDRKWLLPATVAVAATCASHFETGYLAVGAIPILYLVDSTPWRSKGWRFGGLLLGVAGATAWVTVPLIDQFHWAAVNTFLSRTGLARGYGARVDLEQLFAGHSFDNGRWPVVSALVALGLYLAIRAWRKSRYVRPFLAMFVCSLLLSFGSTTWGPVADIIPGHNDLFFRRFLLGVQLSGLYLAGYGFWQLTIWVRRFLARRLTTAEKMRESRLGQLIMRDGLALLLLGTLLLAPLVEVVHYDRHNSSMISAQAQADRTADPLLQPIVRYVVDHRIGRIYAGSPTNWGNSFRVGYVAMYSYLSRFDVPEIGLPLRTASLLSQPEQYFRDNRLSDYQLFGISYLLTPTSVKPAVASNLVMRSGPYELWRVQNSSYISTGTLAGTVTESRANIAQRSYAYMNSDSLSAGIGYRVKWSQKGATELKPVNRAIAALERERTSTRIVRAKFETDVVRVVVNLPVSQFVSLGTSYDPGWRGSIDGIRAKVFTLLPAEPAIVVPAGRHIVTFRFRGFSGYPFLVLIAGLTFLLVGIASFMRRSPMNFRETRRH